MSGGWYGLAKPALFALDAETAHNVTLSMLSAYARVLPRPGPVEDGVEQMGLTFGSRLGLAAGLDKNARAIPAWQRLGFGFVEVGTVTAYPQPGNPPPRLFRIPEAMALFNRMGFNNEGAEVVGQRLARLRDKDAVTVPVGINLGKSKVTPNAEAAADYKKSFRATAPYADYVVINVSSPNTPGLRNLQSTEQLAIILDAVMETNQALDQGRPVLVKLAPDLADEDTLACADTARDRGCAGLIISNTTIDKSLVDDPPDGSGGLSGAPLLARSTAQLKQVRDHVGPDFTLIGVGGVTDAAGAEAKRNAGADLVQIYSGLIYRGPRLIDELTAALADG